MSYCFILPLFSFAWICSTTGIPRALAPRCAVALCAVVLEGETYGSCASVPQITLYYMITDSKVFPSTTNPPCATQFHAIPFSYCMFGYFSIKNICQISRNESCWRVLGYTSFENYDSYFLLLNINAYSQISIIRRPVVD